MTDKLTATLDKAGVRAISTDLWGIFFEDISYSGDGGLNADLVQNGAFEYNRADSIDWSNYSFWRKIVPEGSFAAFGIHDNDPVATENPHYATVEVEHAPAALDNTGWDGMVFRAGETYDFTAWMRVRSESAMPVTVSLRGDDGSIIAENTITVSASAWTTYQASLTVPEHGDAGSSVATQGTLRLAFAGEGVIDLDFVTLEPRTTYHGLKHFRPDLVEALADLKPRFMRFPGGCITHGLGMDNMYHWDRTIGPVEHRPHNFNLWGYHQSFRIGYYEYLCLCETIGAKPLPVLPAGVSCQTPAKARCRWRRRICPLTSMKYSTSSNSATAAPPPNGAPSAPPWVTRSRSASNTSASATRISSTTCSKPLPADFRRRQSRISGHRHRRHRRSRPQRSGL